MICNRNEISTHSEVIDKNWRRKKTNLILVKKNGADDEISSFCSDLHQLRGPAGGWVGECGAPAGVGPAAKIIQNPHFALACCNLRLLSSLLQFSESSICVSCPHTWTQCVMLLMLSNVSALLCGSETLKYLSIKLTTYFPIVISINHCIPGLKAQKVVFKFQQHIAKLSLLRAQQWISMIEGPGDLKVFKRFQRTETPIDLNVHKGLKGPQYHCGLKSLNGFQSSNYFIRLQTSYL